MKWKKFHMKYNIQTKKMERNLKNLERYHAGKSSTPHDRNTTRKQLYHCTKLILHKFMHVCMCMYVYI